MPTLGDLFPRIALFRDTFAEEANLVDHTPTPDGGPAWEYDAADSTFVCHNPPTGGYLDGVSAAVPARNGYVIPVGVKRWEMSIDIWRHPVDAVGGGISLFAYCAPGPIAGFTTLNTITFGVRRVSANSVQFSVLHERPALPSGPATVNIWTGDVIHLGDTSRRYILRVDEVAGTAALFVADAATGDNEQTLEAVSTSPPTGGGLLPDELLAHIADDPGDRLIALEGWDPSGNQFFTASDMQAWDLGISLAADPCTFLLQVFEDDRETVLWEVATDRNHPFPYLEQPDDYAEQEIDIAKGAATIGTVRVTVLDKGPAGDQDGGFLMDKLATLAGRRARLIHFDDLGNPVIVIDGPASLPSMADYPAFSFEIQDTRETEQDVRLFDEVLPTVDVSEDEADLTPTTGGLSSGIAWNTQLY